MNACAQQQLRTVNVERECAHAPDKIWRALTQSHLTSVVTWTLTPTAGTRLRMAQSGFRADQEQAFHGARQGPGAGRRRAERGRQAGAEAGLAQAVDSTMPPTRIAASSMRARSTQSCQTARPW